MKKVLISLLTVMTASCMMLSCSSSEVDEDIDTTKIVVNMVSDPQPIQLTKEQ